MQIAEGGIAFFDSGIGGLTVLAECCRQIKGGVFYYYGDNTHAPYGNLPPEKIKEYVFQAFEKFRRLKVRAAVIACNTATAVCVEELRKKYDFPIIGAEPAVYSAAAKSYSSNFSEKLFCIDVDFALTGVILPLFDAFKNSSVRQ